MIALLLLPLLALALGINSVVDSQVEQEAERIAENNGLDDFDPDAPSIFDNLNVELGTNDPDVLGGTPGDDIIFGLGQTDMIRGFAGNDLIDGGTNNDTLIGGDGNDTIGGGPGFDRLVGGEGNDYLLGNNGDDVLLGREGDDLLIGGGDKDTLSGGAGDDLLISGLLTVGDNSEALDLSSTAVRAIAQFGSENITEADLEALRESGAFNGTDTRFFDTQANPPQGGTLSGGPGDDVLVLSGGDRAEGDAGADTFVLNEAMRSQQTVFIEDYVAGEDVIAIQFGGDASQLDVRDREDDAIIFLGEQVIARVIGGAGLTAGDITLLTPDADVTDL